MGKGLLSFALLTVSACAGGPKVVATPPGAPVTAEMCHVMVEHAVEVMVEGNWLQADEDRQLVLSWYDRHKERAQGYCDTEPVPRAGYDCVMVTSDLRSMWQCKAPLAAWSGLLADPRFRQDWIWVR